ncbi:MAG TPA: DUF6804 family protein [Microbacteriaceae bacterium]|nr:DUF6804 family protein [Microbacteriaceae bacterium]
MKDDRYGSAEFSRAAVAPGLLGAIALLAGLALIGGSWFIGVQYAACLFACILCIIAGQAKVWWWLIGLVPIVVVWNPVFPLTLGEEWWRLAGIAGSAVFVAAGLFIHSPLPENTPPRRRRR